MYDIFTYIWLIFYGKYISPVDPMGNTHTTLAPLSCAYGHNQAL